MRAVEPTPAYLRECFDYEASTGRLRWRLRPESHFRQERWHAYWAAMVGKLADERTDKDGYRYVTIERQRYRAHRVVLAMHNNRWPPQLVDHRDRDVQNNRLANLREATPVENQRNKVMKPNKTGFKGVYRTGAQFSDAKRFQAMIMVNRKATFLGLYPTAAEAYAAYCAAEKRYFGEFARAA